MSCIQTIMHSTAQFDPSLSQLIFAPAWTPTHSSRQKIQRNNYSNDSPLRNSAQRLHGHKQPPSSPILPTYLNLLVPLFHTVLYRPLAWKRKKRRRWEGKQQRGRPSCGRWDNGKCKRREAKQSFYLSPWRTVEQGRRWRGGS